LKAAHGSACSSHPEEGIPISRFLRWCTLAGITAGLLGLTVQASGATGWTVVTPHAGAAGVLTGSYALSDTDTWAVGFNGSDTIALHWNGTTWSSVPTPAPSGTTPNWMLKSVAAGGASDAWAVGVQTAGTKVHNSLYEHWNGTAWSVVTGPDDGVLTAVLDFSPTNAWAFADFSVLHWNGSAWSAVSGAYPALAVSADSPDDFWGIYRNNQVTHYNGTSWSVYTLPGPSGTAFESVQALSPTDVWAAGTNGTGALLEHFNGTSWQTVTLPSSLSATGLPAIIARSDSDVTVFSYNDLIATWNGSSWTTTPLPLPSGTNPAEVSIGSAADSPGHSWLFGENGSTGAPLILEDS
jgi:hypothetical protein